MLSYETVLKPVMPKHAWCSIIHNSARAIRGITPFVSLFIYPLKSLSILLQSHCVLFTLFFFFLRAERNKVFHFLSLYHYFCFWSVPTKGTSQHRHSGDYKTIVFIIRLESSQNKSVIFLSTLGQQDNGWHTRGWLMVVEICSNLIFTNLSKYIGFQFCLVALASQWGELKTVAIPFTVILWSNHGFNFSVGLLRKSIQKHLTFSFYITFWDWEKLVFFWKRVLALFYCFLFSTFLRNN